MSKIKKRGRPRLAAKDRKERDPQRIFRCDDATWQKYQRAAAAAGVSVSEFLRDSASRAAKKLLQKL